MNKNCEKLALIFSFFLALSCWGDRMASLPGGLVFPSFSTSALVNTAALVMDWRTEAKVLYSPPLREEFPHSYLASVAHSNGRLGFNVGLDGSYQDNSAISGAFVGGAFRLSQLALGVSARKANLRESGSWNLNLSSIYQLTYYTRLGVTYYGANDDKQLGLGIGVGIPQKHTFELDLLIPTLAMGKGLSDQYSANATLTSYSEKAAIALGLRFDRQQDGFSNPNTLTGFVGTALSVGRSVNLTALYETQPNSLTLGLVWVWSPPARNVIEYFKAQNRKTIWNKGS